MYKSPIDLIIDVNIDKDELIRALMYDRDQYQKGYADGEADATPKWISVKEERKPKGGEDTLVVVFNGYETYIDIDFFMGDRQWYLESENRKVTHWMPLPEPPKEENDG